MYQYNFHSKLKHKADTKHRLCSAIISINQSINQIQMFNSLQTFPNKFGLKYEPRNTVSRRHVTHFTALSEKIVPFSPTQRALISQTNIQYRNRVTPKSQSFLPQSSDGLWTVHLTPEVSRPVTFAYCISNIAREGTSTFPPLLQWYTSGVLLGTPVSLGEREIKGWWGWGGHNFHQSNSVWSTVCYYNTSGKPHCLIDFRVLFHFAQQQNKKQKKEKKIKAWQES